ncbi:MAG: hypothetical protein ABJN95_18425 [Maribacter sp.]|uniref:hypothetical protein n=1 Tax=Maribacter sp. TaxID=1897614 RepID=UPI003299ADA8
MRNVGGLFNSSYQGNQRNSRATVDTDPFLNHKLLLPVFRSFSVGAVDADPFLNHKLRLPVLQSFCEANAKEVLTFCSETP